MSTLLEKNKNSISWNNSSKGALRMCYYPGTFDPIAAVPTASSAVRLECAFPRLPLRGLRLTIEIPQTPCCEVVHQSTHVHTIFTCHHVRILPYRLHARATLGSVNFSESVGARAFCALSFRR